jgi:hypothetical protein
MKKLLGLSSIAGILVAAVFPIAGCKSSTGPSGGGGPTVSSLSFNSNRGNFSASGVFDTMLTPGSQTVGAWRFQGTSSDSFIVLALIIGSDSSLTVAALFFFKQGTLTAGSLSFPTEAMFLYAPAVDIQDTTPPSIYTIITGQASISNLTNTSAQGSFSGNGSDIFNLSRLISVTNGSFNVNYVSGRPPGFPKSRGTSPIVRRVLSSIGPLFAFE